MMEKRRATLTVLHPLMLMKVELTYSGLDLINWRCWRRACDETSSWPYETAHHLEFEKLKRCRWTLAQARPSCTISDVNDKFS